MQENTASKRNPLSQVNFQSTPQSEPLFGNPNSSSMHNMKSAFKTEPQSKKKPISSFIESEEESEYVKTLKNALAEALAENDKVDSGHHIIDIL
jgi:hypothetical protein